MGTFQLSDLFSPAFGLAAFGGLVLGLLLLKDLGNARLLLSIMLAFGTMTVVDDTVDTKHGVVTKTFLAPLVILRQPVLLGMGVVLALAAVAHVRRLVPNRVSGASYALIFVGCFIGLLHFVHVGMFDGAATIAIALITLGVPALVVPSLLEEYEDFLKIVRAIAFAGIIWNACVFIQFSVNPAALMLGASKRFMGVSGNPQHAACFLAIVGTCSLFLSMNESHHRYRLLWLAQAAVCAVFIGWAGSRTGALMYVIGASAVLYRRLGRAILFLPVIALLIGIAFTILQSMQINVATDRLVSTEDTRSAVWRNMYETGMSNPVLGAGARNAGGSENSFLLAFASYGVGGLMCALLLITVVSVILFRLVRIRSRFDAAAGRLVDLQIGLFGAFFAGSLFEGYLVARLSSTTVMFILFASMSSRLIAIAASEAADTGYVPDVPYDYGEVDEHRVAGSG